MVGVVLILVFEVVMRWGFDMPTIWVFQTAPMMFLAIILLGWANVQRLNRHIRVDILYYRYSPRGKAITDAILTTLIFFPLMIVVAYSAYNFVYDAFIRNEVMIETPWHPLAWPIKGIWFLGVSWLIIQGIVVNIRDWYFAIKGKRFD